MIVFSGILATFCQDAFLFLKQIAHPGIKSPLMPILQVMLTSIGLALERNVAISLMQVAVYNQSHTPLHHIPHKERHEEHFSLLQGMDIFMILIHMAQTPKTFSSKDNSEKIDGPERAKRQISIIDYFHLFLSVWISCQAFSMRDKKIGCHHDNQSSLTLNLIP